MGDGRGASPPGRPVKVVVLASAVGDLRSARRFYARQGGRNLGRRFFETLSETIGNLSDHGGIHVRKFGFYRALAAKFPYSVYYDIEGDAVRVHAVVDNRRNPSWVEDRVAGAGLAQRLGDVDEAWFVREGEKPGYGEGETSDFARKGEEGDAE